MKSIRTACQNGKLCVQFQPNKTNSVACGLSFIGKMNKNIRGRPLKSEILGSQIAPHLQEIQWLIIGIVLSWNVRKTADWPMGAKKRDTQSRTFSGFNNRHMNAYRHCLLNVLPYSQYYLSLLFHSYYHFVSPQLCRPSETFATFPSVVIGANCQSACRGLIVGLLIEGGGRNESEVSATWLNVDLKATRALTRTRSETDRSRCGW